MIREFTEDSGRNQALLGLRVLEIGVHEHPRQGQLNLPGVAATLSKTPGKIVRHAPFLGQDNEYVFRQLLGLTEDEIEELRATGAFQLVSTTDHKTLWDCDR